MTQTLNERYILEEKVGEGGMAVTYRARDLVLNRTVAVKVLRDQFTADPHFVERFRKEAQASARLSHEHIAGIYDTGVADGTYYIVMEFVEGTDLKQRLRREGPLPISTAVEFARQTASALEASHRNGIIHRDIKPHNILLTREGKVKVTDFGIAKLVSDGEDTGVILASVHYVSPEHVRGEMTTPCADIYSLGCVLFEMLTGRTVFDGDSALAVAHKQVYEQPPSPRALRPEISSALEAIVLRCLEKDPRTRYQSAAEVLAVLTQVQQAEQEATIVLSKPVAPPADATTALRRPVRQPQPAAPARPEPEPRGSSAGAWIIVMLFLVLAGVVGYGAWKVFGNTDPDPIGKKDRIVMPDLAGKTADEVKALLPTFGLSGVEKRELNDTVPEGQVFQQTPDPGTDLKDVTQVTYWISGGSTTFTMPGDLVAMTLDAAKRRVREAGFTGLFTVAKEGAEDVPKGQVVRTEPEAGAVVDRKGSVKLVLSIGPSAMKHGVYHPGSAPSLPESATVYVRIEMERPEGSPSELMWESTITPGDPIPDQPFDYPADKRTVVRMLYGKDETSPLETYEEKYFGTAKTP